MGCGAEQVDGRTLAVTHLGSSEGMPLPLVRDLKCSDCPRVSFCGAAPILFVRRTSQNNLVARLLQNGGILEPMRRGQSKNV